MTCPECNGKLVVKRTASVEPGEAFRQRRCSSCGIVIFTEERETKDAREAYFTADAELQRKSKNRLSSTEIVRD